MLEDIWECDQSALSSYNTPDILDSRPFTVTTEHVFHPSPVSLVVVNALDIRAKELAERQLRCGNVVIGIVV